MRKLIGAVALAMLPFTLACAERNYSIADVHRLLDQRKLSRFYFSSDGEYFNGTYNSYEKLLNIRGTKTIENFEKPLSF